MDGSGRDPEDRRDLRSRQSDVVSEHEHRAVLDGEGKEGALDLVLVDQGRDVVGRARAIECEGGQGDGPTARPADLVPTRPDEEPVEPGVEPLRIAQGADVPPGPDERLLDRVLGGIPVAKDASRDRVQAVVRGGPEGIECLVIAPLCALDEIGDHSPSSVAARRRVALTEYVSRSWRILQIPLL